MSLELNKTYQGDCLELLPQVLNDFVDMVLTSPPYDNLRKYKGYVFDFEGVARELFRVVKPGGVVVCVVGDATQNGSETGTSWKQALFFKSLGFNIHDTMLYHKVNYIPLTHRRYEQCWEYMFCFSGTLGHRTGCFTVFTGLSVMQVACIPYVGLILS